MFDLVAMGRCSIDLYSNDIGAPFPEIRSFGAFVGGTPANVAVGAARLGLRTALFSAVGGDPVGDFVLRFLDTERVDTSFVLRKPDRRTAAVLLGIEPPDRFPLTFYREGCADIAIGIDDVPALDTRVLLVTGTGLSREPSRSATFHAVEQARARGAEVVLDLDLRGDQWHDPRAYGIVVRSILPLCDIVVGTEEEVLAAAGGRIEIRDAQVSAPHVDGDLARAVGAIRERGTRLLVLKRGARGARVHADEVHDVAPFAVDVLNVLGAGDAFLAGFLYGHLRGWPPARCARMGNATGAIVVTKPGCANFMPTESEALAFAELQGGLG